MVDDRSGMDVDNQSEDGEIKRSSGNESKDSFSEEEGADTADSLEIKPPQAMIRRHKSSSSRHKEKHSDHKDRRDEKSHKSRHHDRSKDRRRDKHRQRRHENEGVERSKHTDSSRREKEQNWHERKDFNMGDRVLEDLRERLLDKRKERRAVPREIREFSKTESRREVREDYRKVRESRDRRVEIRMEDIRERREIRPMTEDVKERREVREIRMEDRRQVRPEEQIESDSGEQHERERRRKRPRKQSNERDREREKRLERESALHRDKQLRESIDLSVAEELETMEVTVEEPSPPPVPMKAKEMTEQELRRQRLLDAEREMAIRKESSRQELEARRLKRGEKRLHSPDMAEPSVVELSDESMPSPEYEESELGEGLTPRSKDSVESKEHKRDTSVEAASSECSDSSSDDASKESHKNNVSDDSDYENPSPLSVDRLAKSDNEGNSPGKVDGSPTKSMEGKKEEDEEEKSETLGHKVESDLPSYFPSIQGCRSVEEYRCLNRIEEGTYGVVYRAEDRHTNEIVALKRLKMENEKEGFPITSLREIKTLMMAQHPNIVTVREIVVGSNMDKIFIVMDYVEHDLKSLMETMKRKKQVFIPGEVKCLMQQLLRAVAHLHDNWILHRDLKTSNLLLSHKGILKVGDFGLAREYGSPLRHYSPVVVTLWYRAPELLLGSKEYSTPVDMWSVGCIFAELVRMEALFPGKSEIDLLNRIFKELGSPNERIWPDYNKLPLVQKIPFASYPVNNLRSKFGMSLSDSGLDLLNKFLTYDPVQRTTAETAIKHPYFEEVPLPINTNMFPTWPAKSELESRNSNASPKPPSGGREYKELGDGYEDDLDSGRFHMGHDSHNNRHQNPGGGFYLKF